MVDGAYSECAIADEKTELEVSVQRSLRQIGRRNEYRLIVCHDRLGVKYTRRLARLERSRVVVDVRSGRSEGFIEVLLVAFPFVVALVAFVVLIFPNWFAWYVKCFRCDSRGQEIVKKPVPCVSVPLVRVDNHSTEQNVDEGKC